MSLASDYAALQTTQAADQATLDATVPAPLVGPSATFSVTKEGNLRVVNTSRMDVIEASPLAAKAVADWIYATFV